MMKGRNNGKKLLAVRIVAHAFEIIHLLTDQNPIQVGLFFFLNSHTDKFPTCRFSSMPLSTLALVKTPHESALKVLSVAKLLMFHLCEESIKPYRFSLSAYVQPILQVRTSYYQLRHGNPHFATSNQSQNASQTNSLTQRRVLRTRTLSRYILLCLDFCYCNVTTLLTEKRRTRACRQVKSVKVRFPRISWRFCLGHIFFTPHSHPGLYLHVSVCHPRVCLTAIACAFYDRQNRKYLSPNTAI